MLDEIAGFFEDFIKEDFIKAFLSFNGSRIVTLHAPCVALRGDGSIQCLASRPDIGRFFQSAVDGCRRAGCRSIRFRNLEAIPIGGRSALGTVTGELLREDGSVLRQWRQSYNLVRVEPGWQVLASTYHVG
jgi:hypothetical protein